ncbi:MAG: class I tRNA ligase family protein, partial [Chloroflexi bacterium]|nr:class I tRNA ligase family protein [Chloroflexota bacterium]
SRNFANKLWNAARYVVSNLDGADGLEDWHRPNPQHRQDRWILSRLNRVIQQAQQHMEEYQFGEAQRALHDFLWGEYCDWYLEMCKIRLRSGDGESPLPTLAYVLERVLRLLHPFMPFITEEIWQALMDILPVEANRPEALVVAPYPEPNPALIDAAAEAEIGAIVEMVRAIRNLRAEFRIQPNQSLEAIVDAPAIASVVDAEGAVVKSLARVEPLTIGSNGGDSPDNVAIVLSSGTVTVPLHGLVDVGRERERLGKELDELRVNHARLSARLQDEKFTSRAPEDVVERERERLANIEERQARVNEILSRLGA